MLFLLYKTFGLIVISLYLNAQPRLQKLIEWHIKNAKATFSFAYDSQNLLHTSIYRTHAIISRGLYIFYLIFHCSLYCRAVYNAKRLLFHDFFLIWPLWGRHPKRSRNSGTYVLTCILHTLIVFVFFCWKVKRGEGGIRSCF